MGAVGVQASTVDVHVAGGVGDQEVVGRAGDSLDARHFALLN